MLQAVDSAVTARREWLGLLSRAPLELLESWGAGEASRRFTWLRRPQTGLAMVRARAGNSGERFNLGEMTLTRCALRLACGTTGIGYVQGRSHRRAELAALADALLQTSDFRARVEESLLAPLRSRLVAQSAAAHARAQATRVEFFTLARESGA
jgi:alpha-D-ribose 1-methylphosphonate 5-triphosphate synthase subunit PhnG